HGNDQHDDDEPGKVDRADQNQRPEMALLESREQMIDLEGAARIQAATAEHPSTLEHGAEQRRGEPAQRDQRRDAVDDDPEDENANPRAGRKLEQIEALTDPRETPRSGYGTRLDGTWFLHTSSWQ